MAKCKYVGKRNKKQDFPKYLSMRRYVMMVYDGDPYCDCPSCYRHSGIKYDRTWKRHRRNQWRVYTVR